MNYTKLFGLIALFPTLAHGAQELLVSSYLHNDVLAFDAQTGASLGVFVPTGSGGLSQPGEMVIGTNQDLFVSSSPQHRVYRYNGQNGTFIQSYPLPNSDSLRGIAFGGDGNLYVADTTAHKIQKFDPASGSYLGAFASTSGAPIGINFGPDGNLYAAIASTAEDSKDGHVERFNALTGLSLGTFGPSNFNNPQALTFGPDHNLYVHIQYDYKIVKLDGFTGQLVGTFVNESYPFNPSSGITFGPGGNLYTGNLTAGAPNDGIRRYNGITGAFIDNFVPGGGNFWSTGLVFTVPEPAVTGLLILAALVSLVFCRKRKRTFGAIASPHDTAYNRSKGNSCVP
jgi:DNA-binding beta-propeller fold protein YncE